jgi:hypothetical protein
MRWSGYLARLLTDTRVDQAGTDDTSSGRTYHRDLINTVEPAVFYQPLCCATRLPVSRVKLSVTAAAAKQEG